MQNYKKTISTKTVSSIFTGSVLQETIHYEILPKDSADEAIAKHEAVVDLIKEYIRPFLVIDSGYLDNIKGGRELGDGRQVLFEVNGTVTLDEDETDIEAAVANNVIQKNNVIFRGITSFAEYVDNKFYRFLLNVEIDWLGGSNRVVFDKPLDMLWEDVRVEFVGAVVFEVQMGRGDAGWWGGMFGYLPRVVVERRVCG